MKKWLCVLLSLLMILTITGCTSDDPVPVVDEVLQEGYIYLYYVNGSTYELEHEQYKVLTNT